MTNKEIDVSQDNEQETPRSSDSGNSAAAPAQAAERPTDGDRGAVQAHAGQMHAGMAFCNTCGKSIARTAESCPGCGAPNALAKPKTSEKGMVPAALLAFFFGAFGFHRFYVGKIGTGILMILTFGGLGIWALIDFIMILVGSFKDKQGLPLSR